MRKILVLGSYGQSNLGDEEMLGIFISHLRKAGFRKIYVNSSNPGLTTKKYKVTSFSTAIFKDLNLKIEAFLNSKIYFFGGGNVLIEHPRENLKWYSFPNRALYLTLLTCFLGKLMNKKIIFANIGIGPLKTKRSRFLTGLILRLSDTVVVRDSLSKKLAENLSDKIIYLSSDVVLLKPMQSNNSANVISVFPSWHLPVDSKHKEEISEEIVKTINYFHNKKFKVFLIPLWSAFSPINDFWYSHKLKKMGAKAQIVKAETFEKIIPYITKSKFCFSMRLHGAVFSSLCKTPFLAVDYNPKVKGFVNEIDSDYLLKIEEIKFENIVKKLEAITFGKKELANLNKLRKTTKDMFCKLMNGI